MCQKCVCCKAVKLDTVVGEGRGGRAAARQCPRRVAETSSAIQAPLWSHSCFSCGNGAACHHS